MRIRQLVAQLPLLFLGIAQAAAVHAQAKPDRWTPESAFSVKRVGTVAVSPNGQWAAAQVSEAVMDTGRSEWQSAVHVFRVGGAGTQAAVRVDSQASSPAWSPDGRWLAFVSSRSGTRNVWRAPLAGGPAERLTDVSGELGEFRFSPAGNRIAFLMRDPPPPEEPDVGKRVARVLGEGERFARLYVFDLQDRTTRLLTTQNLQVGGHVGAGMTGQHSTGRLTAPPAGGAMRLLAHSFDRRPAIVGWTGDSRAVVITESEGTVRRLSALPADGAAPVELSPDALMMSAPMLNGTGTHVGFVSEAPDRAPEPYTSRLDRFAPVHVAKVQSPFTAQLGRTEVVQWHSDDGREIEGLLTYPVGYRAGMRVPLLTILHGGPPGVFTRTFIGAASSYPIAAFAAAGFAVFRPNVRGSSGYGRELRYANMHDWGGGDFRDLMTGVDAMVERGIADADRLGVMGWSYGGYLTAFTITQTTRFRAASVGAGITNLVSFAGTADIPGFIRSYFGADFWEEPELWLARSAVFNVDAVTTPTLIQHGENDLRVPPSQGLELYTALERRGVPTTMVIYERERLRCAAGTIGPPGPWRHDMTALAGAPRACAPRLPWSSHDGKPPRRLHPWAAVAAFSKRPGQQGKP